MPSYPDDSSPFAPITIGQQPPAVEAWRGPVGLAGLAQESDPVKKQAQDLLDEINRQQQAQMQQLLPPQVALGLLKQAAPDRAARIELKDKAAEYAIASLQYDDRTYTQGPVTEEPRALPIPGFAGHLPGGTPMRMAKNPLEGVWGVSAARTSGGELRAPNVDRWMAKEYPTVDPGPMNEYFQEQAGYLRKAARLARMRPEEAAAAAEATQNPAERQKLAEALVSVSTDRRFDALFPPQQRTFLQSLGEQLLRGTETTIQNIGRQGEPFTDAGRLGHLAAGVAAQADPGVPPDSGKVEKNVLLGSQSLPFAVGGTLASIAAGPAGALAFTYSQVAPYRYQQFRDEGMSQVQARNASVATGVVESIVEQFNPFERQMGLVRLKPGGSWTRTLANIVADRVASTAKETGEEYAQDLSAEWWKQFFQDKNLKESLKQMWADRPNLDYYLDTMLQVAGTMAPGAAVETVGQVSEHADARKSFRNMIGTPEFIDTTIGGKPDGARQFAAKERPSSSDLELIGINRRAGLNQQDRIDLAQRIRDRLAEVPTFTPEAQAQAEATPPVPAEQGAQVPTVEEPAPPPAVEAQVPPENANGQEGQEKGREGLLAQPSQATGMAGAPVVESPSATPANVDLLGQEIKPPPPKAVQPELLSDKGELKPVEATAPQPLKDAVSKAIAAIPGEAVPTADQIEAKIREQGGDFFAMFSDPFDPTLRKAELQDAIDSATKGEKLFEPPAAPPPKAGKPLVASPPPSGVKQAPRAIRNIQQMDALFDKYSEVAGFGADVYDATGEGKYQGASEAAQSIEYSDYVLPNDSVGRSAREEIAYYIQNNPEAEKLIKLVSPKNRRYSEATANTDLTKSGGAEKIAQAIMAYTERSSGARRAELVADWILNNPEAISDPKDYYEAFRFSLLNGGDQSETGAVRKAKPEIITTERLTEVGQKFLIAGDPHEVTAIDPDMGIVSITDGITRELVPGEEIAIDKGSLSTTEKPGFTGTFREFVESKGVEWETLKPRSKVRNQLKAEYDAMVAGKEPPTAAERARADAKASLERLDDWANGTPFSNPVFDPEFYKIAADIIASHIKAGVLTFAEFMQSIVKKYGEARAEKMRPGFEQAWSAARLTNQNIDEPPAPPQAAEVPQEGRPIWPVSIVNAYTKDLRERLGMNPILDEATRSFEFVRDEVEGILAKNPTAAAELFDDLKRNPRPITDTQDALLLSYLAKLSADYETTLEAWDAASKSGDVTQQAATKEASDLTWNKIQELSDLTVAVGRANSRGLNARKMFADRQFNLVRMKLEARKDRGEKNLNPTAAAKVEELQKKITEMQTAYNDAMKRAAEAERQLAEQEAIRQLKAEVDAQAKAGAPAPPAKKKTPAQTKKEKASAEVQAAITNFKKGWASFTSGTVSSLGAGANDLLAAGVQLIKAYVKQGIASIGAIIENVKSDFSDQYNEQMDAMVRQAWDEYRRSNLSGDDLASAEALSKAARRLAKQAIMDGIGDRDGIVQRVRSDLQTILPDITERETADAISRYGQYQEPTKDDVLVRLSQVSGELRELSKLKDIEAGKPPLRTGKGRPEPSDLERRTRQEVEAAKRRLGITNTDPDRQLRTALDAMQRRVENQISDINWQIENRRQIVNEAKKKGAETPETAAQREEIKRLKAMRDERQAILDEMFPKPGRSNEERIAAALKAKSKLIAEYRRRIQEGDFSPKTRKTEKLTSPELAAADAVLASVRAQYKELEALDNPKVSAQERSDAAYERLLLQRAEEYKTRIANNDFAPKPKRQRTMTPALTKARGELEAAKAEWYEQRREWNRANRTTFQKVMAVPGDALDLSRAILTSFDLSAVLRQGGFLSAGHPLIAAEAFAKMMKGMRTEKDFLALEASIADNDNAQNGIYQRAGLELTGIHGKVINTEEAYRSEWAKKIPGVKHAIGISERAYVAYLNVLRATTFDAMLASLGDIRGVTEAEAKIIANYINVATGRGDLGAMRKNAVGLAKVFFAPRWVWSRFQLLAGQPLAKELGKGSWRVRGLIAKEYAKSLSGIGLFYATAGLALTAMIGAPGSPDDPNAKWSIELDPRSPDFGKIKIGRTRIDPLAGLSQTTVFLTRLAIGQTKNRYSQIKDLRGPGREWGDKTEWGVITDFIRSKLSPWLGTGVDIITQEDFLGQPVTPTSVAIDAIVPLSLSDIYEEMKAQGVPAGTAIGLLSLFGMSVQTYKADPPLESLPGFPSRKAGETDEHWQMRVGAYGRRIEMQPTDRAAELRRQLRGNKVWSLTDPPSPSRLAGETTEAYAARKEERARDIADAKTVIGQMSRAELLSLLREEALQRHFGTRPRDDQGNQTAYGQRVSRLLEWASQQQGAPQ